MKKFALFAAFALLFALCACGTKNEGNGEAVSVINTVVLVEFGGGETFSADFGETLHYDLETSPVGLKAFFAAESLGRCSVTSRVAAKVRVEKPASYYFARKGIGTDGYTDKKVDGKPHADAFVREQTLVREILSKAEFPQGYSADADGDGYADGITFVFLAEFSPDEKIMWPHKSEFYGTGALNSLYVPEGFFGDTDADALLAPSYINGAEAYRFAVVSSDYTVGQVCHEFSHVLGLPDYYSYGGGLISANDNIGHYELLGASPGKVPQFSLAYVRMKAGWLKEGRDINVLSSSGEVILPPVTAGGAQAVKLAPAGTGEKGEFFMAEVRRKTSGSFDDAVNSSGVIIYSVKPENAYIAEDGNFGSADLGNMYGNGRFEVKLISSGLFNYFTADSGRNQAELKYADGTSAGVSVTVEEELEGGSYRISFRFAETEKPEPSRPKLIKAAGGNVLAVRWEGEEGVVRIVSFVANSRSAAAFATDNLPSAKDIISGNYGSFTAEETLVLARASRFAYLFPKGERFVAIVTEKDGKAIYYDKFRVTVEGSAPAEYSFADVLAVSFSPGNPAFFAGCAILGLCVLAGIIAPIIVKNRRSRR